MAHQTPIISYNLKDRGRRYRGKPRSFDVRAIVDCINGGSVQERVKHRDMFGYYGHWPRVRLGLNPSEGGIVDGKVIHIEPAFVTTYLKALPDGTIEHQAEFLDNAPGTAACGLNRSKTGGFSSAIDENKPEFYGFDYVLEPNFSTNRAYKIALDDSGEEIPPLTLDEVNDYNASAKEMADAMEMVILLDGVNADNSRLRDAILNMEIEREELEDEVARLRQRKGAAPIKLDSVGDLHFSRNDGKAALFARADELRSKAAEVRLAPPVLDSATEAKMGDFRAMIGFVP
jgi:hypothetical protein